MRPEARLALLAIAGVAALWSGVQLYRYLSPAPVVMSAPDGATHLSADATPRPGIQADGNIPDQLPDFTLADLNGTKTSVSTWRGKSLMINFWATWCPPCRREIPLLQALHDARSAQDFAVIGIAVDYVDKVRAFKEQYKISYPLLAGEQDALDLAAALGVVTLALPFTVFTDRRGRIVTLYLGELKRPVADAILAVVEDINQERVALTPARERIATQVRALRDAH